MVTAGCQTLHGTRAMKALRHTVMRSLNSALAVLLLSLRSGQNQLQIEFADRWPNRLVSG